VNARAGSHQGEKALHAGGEFWLGGDAGKQHAVVAIEVAGIGGDFDLLQSRRGLLGKSTSSHKRECNNQVSHFFQRWIFRMRPRRMA